MMETLTRILHLHNAETILFQNRLYAETSYTKDGAIYDEWVDVTSWSVRQVYTWLGY